MTGVPMDGPVRQGLEVEVGFRLGKKLGRTGEHPTLETLVFTRRRGKGGS